MSDTSPYGRLRGSGTAIPRRDRLVLGAGSAFVISLGVGTDVTASQQCISYADINDASIAEFRLTVLGGNAPTSDPLIVDILKSSDQGQTWASIFAVQSEMPALTKNQFVSTTPYNGSVGLNGGDLLSPSVVLTGATRQVEIAVLIFYQE